WTRNKSWRWRFCFWFLLQGFAGKQRDGLLAVAARRDETRLCLLYMTEATNAGGLEAAERHTDSLYERLVQQINRLVLGIHWNRFGRLALKAKRIRDSDMPSSNCAAMIQFRQT